MDFCRDRSMKHLQDGIFRVFQIRRAGVRGAEEQVEIPESIHATPGRRRFRWRHEVDGEIHVGAAGDVRSAGACPGHGGCRARSAVRHIPAERFAASHEEVAGVRTCRQEEKGGAEPTPAAAPTTQATGQRKAEKHVSSARVARLHAPASSS